MPTKLLIIVFSMTTALGQLLLKRGVTAIALDAPPTLATLPRFISSAARSPWVIGALAVQGLAYVIWMIVISRSKLGIATASAGAAFYLLVALAAWGFYGESLSYLQWLGIGLITVGVTFVSLGPT